MFSGTGKQGDEFAEKKLGKDVKSASAAIATEAFIHCLGKEEF